MSEHRAIRDEPPVRSAEFEAAARLTHVRLELALAMQTLRANVGLTQQERADRLGLNQPAVAKLERVGVSDDRDRLLVVHPREVDDWAAAAGMDLDAYVMQALCEARAKTAGHDTRRGEDHTADPA